MRLTELLTLISGKNFFLPAHGRGNALSMDIRTLLRKKPGVWDLPELPEIGGPICSTGAVVKSQSYSAELFGAKKCWYGVNGATGLFSSCFSSCQAFRGYINALQCSSKHYPSLHPWKHNTSSF